MSQISTKTIDLHAHARDASHYLLLPKEIAKPSTVYEIASLIKSNYEKKQPLTFRSGGTSLSGQSISNETLVDTRRSFKKIEILDNGKIVRVEPGVTVREVNNRLKQYGYKLGPDPASEIACTIGGVVANNSSGMFCGTEFNAYQTIQSLKIVFSDGSILDTGDKNAENLIKELHANLYAELLSIKQEINSKPHLKESIRNHFRIKNTMGYGLNSFIDFNSINEILTHLIVGSEGTLAFVSEVTFRTVPIKPFAASSLLIFEDLSKANQALLPIIESGAAAIELLDKTSLNVAKRENKSLDFLKAIDISEQSGLIIEYQEESSDSLRESVERAENLIRGLKSAKALPLTEDLRTRNEMWHIRKGLYASVAGMRKPGTTALLEDIAVPVSELTETCESLITLFEKYHYKDSVIFGHARDGNIHFMINEDFRNKEAVTHYKNFTEDMVELVLGHNGTLKAEHGTGRVMAPFVRKQYGDELYELMRRIKFAFDPRNIFNPDVIITDDSELHLKNLKITPEIDETVNNCVECGFCEPGCPSKNLTLTPRQRIVLNRALVSLPDKDRKAISNDYRYQSLDTCATDSICALYCPLKIDTGQLVRIQREKKSYFWKKIGANYASALFWIRNGFRFALKTPLLKSFFTKYWNFQYFTNGTKRKSLMNPNPDAVYLPSCIGEFLGPTMQPVVEKLFDRANLSLYIPDGIDNYCCGTPWKSKGHEGYVVPSLNFTAPVITDNSSCTNAYKAIDINQYVLERLVPKLNIEKVNKIVVHPTCSSEKRDGNASLIALANLMAEEVIVPPNWNCCGFAGDRGFIRPELTQSATEAESDFLKDIDADFYVSDNKGCEVAMSNSTQKEFKNILEVLLELAN